MRKWKLSNDISCSIIKIKKSLKGFIEEYIVSLSSDHEIEMCIITFFLNAEEICQLRPVTQS